MTRPLSKDLISGLKGCCPNCDKGRLFKSYLKVNEHCPDCQEEYFHQRADDMPAYFAILIVGHVVVGLATGIEVRYSPSYLTHLLLWIPLTVGMTLAILQPIKGAAVAIQWRMGMHGFRKSKQMRDEQNNG